MRLRLLVLGIGLGSTLLVGCAGSSADRRADGSVPNNLGVNMCITNATSRPVAVTFSVADTTRGAGSVPPDGVACGEGTRGLGPDVTGVINAGTAGHLTFSARNPWIGAPYVEVVMANDIGLCTGSGWDVGESHAMSSPDIEVSAVRRADDGWKQFAVTLTDGDGAERGSDCHVDPL